MRTKTIRKFVFGGLLVTSGILCAPLYIISERVARPNRYHLLSSNPAEGLKTLWTDKRMNLKQREEIYGKDPLYSLFTKLYGDMCHDPMTDFGSDFENVEFDSSEEVGLTLRGWVVPAKNSTNTMVILCHGAFTDRREMLRHCKYLCSSGYDCMLFDFRDHGTSDSTLKRGTSLGIREHQDIIDAVNKIKSMPAYRSKSIVVMGSSTGAASAILAASKDIRINMVIAENPFSHRRKQVKEALRDAFDRSGQWGGEKNEKYNKILSLISVPQWYVDLAAFVCDYRSVVGSGYSLKNTLEVIDVVNKIAPRPLLLIHGTDDRMVKISHSEQLYESAGQPKDLWRVEKGRHSMLHQLNTNLYEERIVSFIKDNLV
ncbi:hypothetical protein AKO1_008964 [Acrasis kona]|uniref:Serine aminopeptidase S33 domain-containing protein n=1 Tax=Acrasis kona TaxID=1008807 RepID=A0AAW2ZEG1_9EUKA